MQNVTTFTRLIIKGVRPSVAYGHVKQMGGFFTWVDAYIGVMIGCVYLIGVILSHADAIDAWRITANQWQTKAIENERVIVSMLNGSVILNGRERTICMFNAAGECERKN